MSEKPYKLSGSNMGSLVSTSEHKLFELYLKNKEDFDSLEANFEKIKQSCKIDQNCILEIISRKPIFIPISIFKNALAPLEAIVIFLKDIIGLKFHDIASDLNRDDRTIWLTYNNGIKKNVNMDISSDFYLPLTIFSERRFSILEILVSYLKQNLSLPFKKISLLIDKNPKTIWTVYNRYTRKLEGI